MGVHWHHLSDFSIDRLIHHHFLALHYGASLYRPSLHPMSLLDGTKDDGGGHYLRGGDHRVNTVFGIGVLHLHDGLSASGVNVGKGARLDFAVAGLGGEEPAIDTVSGTRSVSDMARETLTSLFTPSTVGGRGAEITIRYIHAVVEVVLLGDITGLSSHARRILNQTDTSRHHRSIRVLDQGLPIH